MKIDTNSSFSSKSCKFDFLSWCTILRALLCILLILLFRPLLWYIQTNGQELDWDVIKVLNKIRYLRCDKYCEILDSVSSFWLAF